MIIVIGGGIIGLSIGWQLARHGFPVRIIDAGSAGQQASQAAAGLLTPLSEVHCPSLASLGKESLVLYPRFLDELRQDSHSELSLHTQGTLMVAMSQNDIPWLERVDHHPILSPDELHRLEPLLSSKVLQGLWVHSEGQINNRKVLIGLLEAFKAHNGELTENCVVRGVRIQKEQVIGVDLADGGFIAADVVINCAGAWAASISPFPIAVRPNKGQIITVRCSQDVMPSRAIRTPKVYLVPKDDGTLRIGATDEDVGFDTSVTSGAVQWLLNSAIELFPAIRDSTLLETVASLRPVTSHGLPIVGATEIAGYYTACGHGRNGILLAPLTAYQMMEEVRCRYSAMVR